MSEAQTSKRERVIANGADPVLGLPELSAFDADPRVQYVVPGESDEPMGVGGRDRSILDRLAEDEFKPRPERTELARRHEREVDLEAARK